MADSLRATVMYVVLGVVLAFAINQGLATAMMTDKPIVAVESNSMAGNRPDSFSRGDILFLQGQEQYKVDDIIVYSVPQQSTPIVHRIIKINQDGTYQTKGDANAGQLPFETSVKLEWIHGKVVFIVPYLGFVKITVTEYIIPNAVVIIGAIIALVIATFGIERFVGRKE
ncbi:MAG: signal peptidase I [Nanoarchaeota archaeon]|nr:signal peptidase I [Nanoarchaeota archaeon]